MINLHQHNHSNHDSVHELIRRPEFDIMCIAAVKMLQLVNNTLFLSMCRTLLIVLTHNHATPASTYHFSRRMVHLSRPLSLRRARTSSVLCRGLSFSRDHGPSARALAEWRAGGVRVHSKPRSRLPAKYNRSDTALTSAPVLMGQDLAKISRANGRVYVASGFLTTPRAHGGRPTAPEALDTVVARTHGGDIRRMAALSLIGSCWNGTACH